MKKSKIPSRTDKGSPSFLSTVRTKVGATFQIVKEIWLSSGMSFNLISQASLARWGALEYFNFAIKAVQNPYAYRAIIIVADVVSSIPLIIEKLKGEEVDVVKNHDVLKLLRRPNKTGAKTKIQFFNEIVWDLHLGGEFFVWAQFPDTGPNAGRPQRLKLLRPNRVIDIKTDEFDEPVSYKYRKRRRSTPIYIPADEVLHVRLFNPTTSDEEDMRGLPILIAAIRAIELMREAEDWNKSISQQKGKTPGFFKRTERGATDGQKMSELREEVQDNWRRDSSESLPGVMPWGWDWQSIGTNLKDAEFIEGDKANMRKIAVALGVDPALLGDSTNRTLANLREALRGLLILRAIPLLEYVLDSFTVFFEDKKMLTEMDRIAINRKEIEALQEELTARYERAISAKNSGVLTIDEAREEISKPPLGGASGRQYVPINSIPLDEVSTSDPGADPTELSESELGRELKEFSLASFEALIGRSNGITNHN